MSRAVFVDTSAWYALTDNGDANHAPAARILRHLVTQRRPLLTTNHVTGLLDAFTFDHHFAVLGFAPIAALE